MNELEPFESPLTAVATPVTIDLPTTWARCFVGVKLVDGADAPIVTGTSGTFTVAVFGPYSDTAQDIVGGNVITAPALQILSFSMNATKIVVTPAGVAGAVKYKVIVGVNKF